MFKSSKNQKYFKNYFVKESTNLSSPIACNFCRRAGHISSTCYVRNGPQKASISKVKKIWVENSKVTNPQGSKRYGYLNLLELCSQGSKKDKWFSDSGYSKHMIEDEFKFSFLTRKIVGYVTFGDNDKGR